MVEEAVAVEAVEAVAARHTCSPSSHIDGGESDPCTQTCVS